VETTVMRAARVMDIGAKSICLHRDWPVRQPDRCDVGVGPDAGTAGKPPRQSALGQFELMGGAD
jgi:hypothetical protein